MSLQGRGQGTAGLAVNALPCPHPHIPGEKAPGRQRAWARRALPGAVGVLGSLWEQSEAALCPPAHIQVVDEGLVGLQEGVAVLGARVQPFLGSPEVPGLPPSPQLLPQGAAPGQGHPADRGVLVTPVGVLSPPMGSWSLPWVS